jgi:hypothetical protein
MSACDEPMSGFDNIQVDETFFGEGDRASWRSNIICNLGYGDPTGLPPRDPTLPRPVRYCEIKLPMLTTNL